MLKVILIVNTFVLLVLADCKGPCKTEFKIYKELGCKPIKEEGKCCPVRYECPKISDRDGSKCYYNGKTYNIGNQISRADADDTCTGSCYCARGNKAHFVCAAFDCPENFRPYNPDCVYQFEFKSCCTTKPDVCGADKDKLSTCYLDGEKYYEGQRMYPKTHECHSCLCQKGFDNSTVTGNQYCWESNCATALRNSDKINEGCIPIYFESSTCCPIAWRCPEKNDKLVTEARTTTVANPELQCTFGKILMSVGDSLSPGEDRCTTCKCVVPPMAHCVMTQDC